MEEAEIITFMKREKGYANQDAAKKKKKDRRRQGESNNNNKSNNSKSSRSRCKGGCGGGKGSNEGPRASGIGRQTGETANAAAAPKILCTTVYTSNLSYFKYCVYYAITRS